jgi:hypothetical protein
MPDLLVLGFTYKWSYVKILFSFDNNNKVDVYYVCSENDE